MSISPHVDMTELNIGASGLRSLLTGSSSNDPGPFNQTALLSPVAAEAEAEEAFASTTDFCRITFLSVVPFTGFNPTVLRSFLLRRIGLDVDDEVADRDLVVDADDLVERLDLLDLFDLVDLVVELDDVGRGLD